MKRLRVAVGDLELGMYVAELDRPWLGSPFLFQGFRVQSQDDLAQLRDFCKFVYVDLEESLDWAPAVKAATDAEKHRFTTRQVNRIPDGHYPTRQDRQAYVTELTRAVETYRHTHHYIRELLDDVRLGRSIETGKARDLAASIADSVVQEENAMVWLTQLKKRDEYTSQHSINVCVLSVLFGRYLGWSIDELRELGLGALVHDIGKMRVPLEVLNKAQSLDDAEMEQMREHPRHGYRILHATSGVPRSVQDVAYCHHERVDGSGYPRGLAGGHIPRNAMLVSIVDVYDAITSDRVYHMGISPHEALNVMYGWATKSFPTDLLEEFIKCLGIFPIGSVVELSSGEVGVVMTVNRQHHLYPIVTVVLNGEKRPYPQPKLVDLQALHDGGHPLHIQRILESGAYGIDMHQIIGLQHPLTSH